MSMAELERDTIHNNFGVRPDKILIPEDPREGSIRNTYREAEFAIETVANLSRFGRKKLLVEANPLHMRRVLAAYGRQLKNRQDIDLYWESAGEDTDYGPGYFQFRYCHPLMLLLYEIPVLMVSKLIGWA
jgi:uncharacterized SAM-binding protein YcdF (DUF218 family)